MPSLRTAWDRLTAHEFVRFGLVGGLSAAIYTVVVTALMWIVGWPPFVANICGYAAALPVNFLSHKGFTFRSEGAAGREIVRYILMQSINMLVSGLALTLGMKWFDNVLVSVIAVYACVFVATYLMLKFTVFGAR